MDGITVIEFGIVILSNVVQFANIPSPIYLTEDGKFIVFNLGQLLNALSPIDYTDSGI